MGWLSVLICVIPLFLLNGTEQNYLWYIALGNAVINFWSFGIMHNHATKASKEKIKSIRQNAELESRGKEVEDHLTTDYKLDQVPDWLSAVNLFTFMIGFLMTAYSIYLFI